VERDDSRGNQGTRCKRPFLQKTRPRRLQKPGVVTSWVVSPQQSFLFNREGQRGPPTAGKLEADARAPSRRDALNDKCRTDPSRTREIAYETRVGNGQAIRSEGSTKIKSAACDYGGHAGVTPVIRQR